MKKNSMLNRICGFLSGLVIVVLALAAGAFIIPMLFGAKNMAVISGSMEPAIPVGSMVMVREVNPKELVTGDVITYKMGGTNVTHRIAEINAEKEQIVTKGDANDSQDVNPVAFQNVVGKIWFHVPYLGYLSVYSKTPLGITAACVLIFVLLLLNFIPVLFCASEESSHKKKQIKIKKRI